MKQILPILTALLLCGPISAQISTADFEALRAIYEATAAPAGQITPVGISKTPRPTT